MPMPKTDHMWVERIRAYSTINPGHGPKRIHAALTERQDRQGQNTADVPSERTIGRIIADFRKLPEEQRNEYRLARWPDSCVDGTLPWEAGAALLEILRHRSTRREVPASNRVALWFWRLTQSVPDLDVMCRDILAQQCVIWEVIPDELNISAARGWLIHAPWRSAEHDAEYAKAIDRKETTEYRGMMFSVSGDASPLQLQEAQYAFLLAVRQAMEPKQPNWRPFAPSSPEPANLATDAAPLTADETVAVFAKLNTTFGGRDLREGKQP